MNKILLTIFSMSVSGVLTALIIFALSRVFRHFISQAWRYYIWLIVLVRLLLPFSPQVSAVGKVFSVFNEAPVQILMETEYSDKYELSTGMFPVEVESYSELSGDNIDNINFLSAITDNIWLFWLCVSLVLIVQKTTKHYSFIRFIKSGGFIVTDPDILEIYNEVCRSMKIVRPPKIYINKIIVSPLLVGIFQPFIVLPGIGFSAQQLRYVFRHELTHYKRMDVIYKWLSQIVVSIHWFNPSVYMVIREINKLCELSCDESVIRKMDIQEKQFYGDTLICAIRNTGGYFENVAVATMSENIKYLKERLVSIMNHSPRTKVSIVISVSLTFLIMTGAVYSGAYANNRDAVIASANTPNAQVAVKPAEQDEPESEVYKSNEVSVSAEVSEMNIINISNGKFYTVFSGFENGYIIIIEETNMPFETANESAVSVGSEKDERRIWFNDKTKSYFNDEAVLDAISKVFQNRGNQNFGNFDSDSDWHYVVAEIIGPYKETADELAVKFYDENNSAYFYAVSQKVGEATRKKLMDQAYEDDRINYFSVLVGNGAEVDYDALGVKAYNNDGVSYFSVISKYMSKAKKTELFTKSYVDDKISFFSVLIDEASGVDYDTLGVNAYNDDKISFFSVVSQYMSKAKKIELFIKSYEDGKINFFSVLASEALGVNYDTLGVKANNDDTISTFSVVNYDALGVKAYNDDQISFFSVVTKYMSKAKKAELFSKSYADGKINFFSVLIDEASDVDFDMLGVKAYNDGWINFFSVLCEYMSKEVKTEILNRAYEDNQIAFFSLLIAELENEADIDAFMEKARKDNKKNFYYLLWD